MGDPVELPEKIFFKIGEVSRIVGAEPHVLRYWEKEFSAIRPRKSRGGQRLYRRADVEALLRIKLLLRDEGFTISGAKKKLAVERAESRTKPSLEDVPDQDIDDRAPDEATRRLMDEVERLKEECQSLRQDRAATARRLAAAEEALRQVRRELAALLDQVSPPPTPTFPPPEENRQEPEGEAGTETD